MVAAWAGSSRFSALVGLLVGIAGSCALLTGEDADAFTWLASFLFFGGLGAAIGITVALVWFAEPRRKRISPNPLSRARALPLAA